MDTKKKKKWLEHTGTVLTYIILGFAVSVYCELRYASSAYRKSDEFRFTLLLPLYQHHPVPLRSG